MCRDRVTGFRHGSTLALLEQLLEGEATETTARFHLVNNSAEVLRKAQLKPAAFQLPKERCAFVLPIIAKPELC